MDWHPLKIAHNYFQSFKMSKSGLHMTLIILWITLGGVRGGEGPRGSPISNLFYHSFCHSIDKVASILCLLNLFLSDRMNYS